MDLFLKNKVVLITGSSKGIGRAIGLEFARERARVVITGRQEKDVANTISEIQKFNGQGYGFVGDLNDENEIKRCLEKVINRWHGIDILISNLAKHSSIDGGSRLLSKSAALLRLMQFFSGFIGSFED